MVHSMTGYGRAVQTLRGREITAALRSVNNRFLDCGVKLPRSFSYGEDAVKQTVKQSFRHMVSFSFFHIKSIGSDQYICVSCQALCDSKKYFIFFICRKVSDLSFGFFCMYSKFSEHFVHVLSPS